MAFVIAIDGPTSSGKSTLAKRISKELGFLNIQTGAMYRCVAKLMLDNNVSIDNIHEVNNLLKNIDISFKDIDDGQLVFLNGEEVTKEIRTKEITDFTSQVASIQCVRVALVEMQRNIAKSKNVVMEGRDIGTNVFPNADLKIFLNANPIVRINRRLAELEKNGEKFDFEEVAESVYKWDEDAIHRGTGALKKAKDCVCIDTTEMTEDELTKIVVGKINEKYYEEVGL